MAVVIKRVDLSDEFLVFLKTALNEGRGRLFSLSARGAYVATSMTLLPQAQVRLKILLPGTKRAFEVKAVVNWENQEAKGRGAFPSGYGVRFTELDSEAVEAIRGILKSAVVPPVVSKPEEAEGRDSLAVDPASTLAFDARQALKEAVNEAEASQRSDRPPCPVCGK